jgi:hypothetical protein
LTSESKSDPGKRPGAESDSAVADELRNPGTAGISSSAVREVVRQWEHRLQVSLQESQAKFVQSADRGEGNAGAFREFLRANLSPKYRIGQGEVVDYRGNRSRQTDVVVADEEQPFQVDESPQLFIVEGVAAAAEVKTTLTKQELRDCLGKAQRFKVLDVVLGKSVMLAPPQQRGNQNSDLLRFYRRRPYFVFAYKGAIESKTLLEVAVSGERPGEPPPIDAIFVLDEGFALNFWDGNGALTYFDLNTREWARGWRWWSEPPFTLVWLLFWLNSVMPRFSMRSPPMLAYLLPGTTWSEAKPTQRRQRPKQPNLMATDGLAPSSPGRSRICPAPAGAEPRRPSD